MVPRTKVIIFQDLISVILTHHSSYTNFGPKYRIEDGVGLSHSKLYVLERFGVKGVNTD